MSKGNGKPGKKPGVPVLKPQPHGGALWAGPARNPVAGTGRPPAALRGSMRDILDEGLPHLREFAIGQREDARPSDQLKAIEIAARIGMDVKVDKGLVTELWNAIEIHVPVELQPALKREFNLIVGRRLVEAVIV